VSSLSFYPHFSTCHVRAGVRSRCAPISRMKWPTQLAATEMASVQRRSRLGRFPSLRCRVRSGSRRSPRTPASNNFKLSAPDRPNCRPAALISFGGRPLRQKGNLLRKLAPPHLAHGSTSEEPTSRPFEVLAIMRSSCGAAAACRNVRGIRFRRRAIGLFASPKCLRRCPSWCFPYQRSSLSVSTPP
jgi:hypothetical protein